MRAARRGHRAAPELHRELRFPYHPHVTVAQDVAPEALDKAYEDLADFSALFEVDGVHPLLAQRAGPVAAAPGLPARRLSLSIATGRRLARRATRRRSARMTR